MEDRSLARVWVDKWIKLGSLRSLIHGPLTQGEEELLLKDIFGINGSWNLSKLSFVLPNEVVDSITATPRA